MKLLVILLELRKPLVIPVMLMFQVSGLFSNVSNDVNEGLPLYILTAPGPDGLEVTFLKIASHVLA